MLARELKNFTLINGELYFQMSDGVLASALSKAESKEELQRVRDLLFGDNDISLYRHLQRHGYYSLKCPKRQLISKGLCEVPRIPKCKEIIVSPRSQRLETTIP